MMSKDDMQINVLAKIFRSGAIDTKIFRSWAIKKYKGKELEPLLISTKQQVIDRLYYGRCPILSEGVTKDFPGPKNKHPFCMTPEDFDEIVAIANVKPAALLEIGSFHGDTAVTVAGHAQIPVVCIDTWLGDLGMWSHPPPRGFLYSGKSIPPTSGFFQRFCANVIQHNVQDKVTCIRLQSSLALRLLAIRKLMFDAIYVDGSHDYIDVFLDMCLAYPLLSENGVMFGDDYHLEDVKAAVDDFCALKARTIKTLPKRIWDRNTEKEVERIYWILM